jgi:chromosome segregation ATPase
VTFRRRDLRSNVLVSHICLSNLCAVLYSAAQTRSVSAPEVLGLRAMSLFRDIDPATERELDGLKSQIRQKSVLLDNKTHEYDILTQELVSARTQIDELRYKLGQEAQRAADAEDQLRQRDTASKSHQTTQINLESSLSAANEKLKKEQQARKLLERGKASSRQRFVRFNSA